MKRLLSDDLVQPRVDYGCISWFPLLNKNVKHKLQKAQNKCVRLCLDLHPRSRIDRTHFRQINWLPDSERVESYIAATGFKYLNRIVPLYINYRFKPSYNRYNTRSEMALDIPLQKTNTRQQGLPFLAPETLTKISNSTKNATTTAYFTHALKKSILNKNCVRKEFSFEVETNLLNNFNYLFSFFFF